MRPETKTYKIRMDQWERLPDKGRFILEHLSFTTDGLKLRRCEHEDAYKITIITNPDNILQSLELEEMQ